VGILKLRFAGLAARRMRARFKTVLKAKTDRSVEKSFDTPYSGSTIHSQKPRPGELRINIPVRECGGEPSSDE